jgi:hypothetical protein
MRLAFLALLVGSTVHAEPSPSLDDLFLSISRTSGLAMPPEGLAPPRFVAADGIFVSPKSYEEISGGWTEVASTVHPQSATAKDGAASWIALDFRFGHVCGMASCMHDPPDAYAHGVALFQVDKGAARPVAWDVARIAKPKELATAKGKPLAAIPAGIDAGAEEPVKQLVAALADPAALGKLVSDRKDAVLFGSELAERYVGGATVRTTLAKWKLAFKVHDGVQAGLTASKTVAFVAANVDAAAAGAKLATPYRMFAILEKSGADWKLVALSFAAGL